MSLKERVRDPRVIVSIAGILLLFAIRVGFAWSRHDARIQEINALGAPASNATTVQTARVVARKDGMIVTLSPDGGSQEQTPQEAIREAEEFIKKYGNTKP